MTVVLHSLHFCTSIIDSEIINAHFASLELNARMQNVQMDQ